MRLSLRNIKFAAFASEETNCFEATLCLDGDPIARVSNDGHGGCDDYEPLRSAVLATAFARLPEAEAYAKSLPPVEAYGEKLPMDLDLAVGELFEAWLVEREFDKTVKKLAVVDGGKVYTYKAKWSEMTPPRLAAFKQKNPKLRVLNEMPRAEALKLFTELAS